MSLWNLWSPEGEDSVIGQFCGPKKTAALAEYREYMVQGCQLWALRGFVEQLGQNFLFVYQDTCGFIY